MELVFNNFLEAEDFDAAMFNQFLKERDGENLQDILENLESKANAIVSSKLKDRFDLKAIFSAEGVERNYLIVHYMVTIVLYLFIRRNAARKVPTDYKDDYKEVMADLDKIQAGKLIPDGLPKPKDEFGEVIKPIISGNRRNNDFYI